MELAIDYYYLQSSINHRPYIYGKREQFKNKKIESIFMFDIELIRLLSEMFRLKTNMKSR